MATVKGIQMRRGLEADFDPSKLNPGEFAVAVDTKRVWLCFASGVVKELGLLDDINAQLAAINQTLTECDANAEEAVTKARQALVNAEAAAVRADAAEADADRAEAAAERAANSASNASATADNANRFATAANTKAETAQNNSILANANAGNALAIAEGMDDRITQMESALTALRNLVDTKFDDAELTSESLLNFLANGQVVVGPLGPFAGGGGGGGGGSSGNNAIIDAHNTTGGDGRTSITLASGAACPLTFTWSSLENEHPTGNGTMKIYVAGALRSTRNIAQGELSVDVSQYLSAGNNAVTVQILDVYSNRKVFAFTVTVISLSLSSSFDASTPYAGAITFPYTPVGAVQKTVYFILDGQTLGTVSTSVSNRQQTYVIPAQQYGSHTLRVYFETELDGDTIRSNELYYEFISIGDGEGDPIITSSFNKTTLVQYSTAAIDYTVYDPSSLTCDVVITVNGNTFQTVTVNREPQSVAIRFDTVGTNVIVIRAGATTKTFTITVTESDADIAAVTEDLALHLTSYGRSNNEEHPETWTSGNISCTLSNFNFVSDGWVQDADGNTVLRTTGAARVTVPYKMFGSDFRTTGKTLEIEFATREIMDYDAVIMTCMSGGKGIEITSRGATLKSEQSEVDTQYKEDEHIRLSFVVEKRAENRLVWVYINGIASRVVQYPTQDDFQQATPVDFTIGSNDATVDIYNIRVYDNDLIAEQIVENWIADTQDVDLMLDRYSRNNVMDAYGSIVIDKLPTDLPYCIIEGDLPTYKGDKKTVSIEFYDPSAPGRNFTATGVSIDVQGTSSAGYARKNFKPKFKNGFELANGTHSDTYQMRPTSIPANVFCFKADVASSEGANNVELVRLYNEACPYKTPAQVQNPNVRQGIDGFPMVVFNRLGDETVFVGKYNFNDDKSSEDVFGFVEGDESWEVKNNTSNRVLWKSADYTGNGWKDDFEARYPEENTDISQIAEFGAWLSNLDTTGCSAAEKAAKLATFKAEIGNYVEIQSALYYYIFTELFLMVDSRAKNMFPSPMGTTIEEG